MSVHPTYLQLYCSSSLKHNCTVFSCLAEASTAPTSSRTEPSRKTFIVITLLVNTKKAVRLPQAMGVANFKLSRLTGSRQECLFGSQ